MSITAARAIEILTMATGKGGIATNPDYILAQKLGISALKAHLAKCPECGDYGTLPAGTLDEPLPDITCPRCQAPKVDRERIREIFFEAGCYRELLDWGTDQILALMEE